MFENEDQPSLTAIQWFNKGYDYDVKEDYDNAIFAYTKAIELNPQDADAYTNRGVVYDTQGKYDLAIMDYTKAIELNPQDGDTYFNKAIACENAGKKTEAIEAYQLFIGCAEGNDPMIEEAKERIRELGGTI